MDRDLTKDEFRRYHDLIYRIAGIHYPNEKLELLSNRIRKRIRSINESSYDSYLRRISISAQSKELQAFLDSITTNETYFFRCQRHWDFFKAWLEEKKAKDPDLKSRGLRIWSAAASNGSEACTMLIVLHQVFGDNFGGMNVEVLGTDLSIEILNQAREATFRPYALTQTDPAIVKRYLKQNSADEFEFDRTLLRNIKFHQHNLMDRLPSAGLFDAVFVRNVMIYFDQTSRERVLDHAYQIMRPGGILLVGESESLLSVKHEFEYLKPSIFTKRSKSDPDRGSSPKPSSAKFGAPAPAS